MPRWKKIEASKFKQQELELKREEMEMSNAHFEVDLGKVRIESGKNEKGMMYEKMRTLSKQAVEPNAPLSLYFITPCT